MNEFERREARQNKEYKPEKGMVKATWVYTGLVIALFLLINFGMEPIRNAVVVSPESLLWWESMLTVSVVLVCAIALWVFYIIKIVKEYREKKAFPPKYWSAWGIVKKSLAVIMTVLAIFVFVNNISHTIADVNANPITETYEVKKITSETEKVATFEYVDEDGKKKEGTCYLYNGLDLECTFYEFRVFRHSNTLIAMKKAG